MIKVELFLLGVLILGMPLGSIFTLTIQRYFKFRDSKILKVRVHEVMEDALEKAPTQDLIEELSTRDDLSNPKKEKRNA